MLACIIVDIVVFVLSPGGGSEPIELYLVEAAARGRSAARRVIRKYSEAAQIDGELPEIGGDALKLKPAGRIVSIGAAHTRGLLHRGVWILVLDPQQHVLVMKRSAATVTCPGSWALVGEHFGASEAWRRRRAAGCARSSASRWSLPRWRNLARRSSSGRTTSARAGCAQGTARSRTRSDGLLRGLRRQRDSVAAAARQRGRRLPLEGAARARCRREGSGAWDPRLRHRLATSRSGGSSSSG